MLDLRLTEISDENARENFKRVKEFVEATPLLSPGLRLYVLTVTKAETNLKIPHGLSFKPNDVIITSITGAGSVTVNYALIDKCL